MKQTSRYIALAAGLLAGVSAWAQHEVIDVTSTYEAAPPEVKKAELPMAVPDSLLRFDLDYNYSVFDSPYQGSRSFKPYYIGIQPVAAQQRKVLYVKAGAGYTLRPTLDVVYTPESRFNVAVTARHDSYIGNWKTLDVLEEDGIVTVGPNGETYWARDMVNSLGVSASHSSDGWSARFGAGYDGISAKDQYLSRDLHSGYLRVDAGTTELDPRLFWKAGLEYRFSADGMRNEMARRHITENAVRAAFSFGPQIGSGHRALVDLDLDVAAYGGEIHSLVGMLTLTPHYDFANEFWRFSLGARFPMMIRRQWSDNLPFHQGAEGMHVGRWRLPIPVASVEYIAYSELVVPYVALGGEVTTHRWSSLVEGNHFIDPLLVSYEQASMENSYDRLRLRLGFRGRIRHTVAYDLSAGYASVHNGLTDALQFPAPGYLAPMPKYAYADNGMAFIKGKFNYREDGFEISGEAMWRNGFFDDRDEAAAKRLVLIAPSHFAGLFRFGYDWHGRLYTGFRFSFESARSGVGAAAVRVPGWVDLGLDARYVMNRRLSLWATAGNFLGQTIQRTFFHAPSGGFVTAGLIFTL